MSETTQTTSNLLRRPVDLEQAPQILTASIALSEAVLRNLADVAPDTAQRICIEDAACTGHWRLVVQARAPSEWELSWGKGREPLRIASGPGKYRADELQLAVFEAGQQFLQMSMEQISGQERAVLAETMLDGRAHFRVTVTFGGGMPWSIVAAAVVRGKGEGVYHVATLTEAPPLKSELH